MAPRDNLEHYEATEAQDLTRLLRALRPPERAVQVPPHVDLTIRAEIWQAQVRRQLSTLLPMARQELIQVIRQALTENPLLEAVAPAADEDATAGEAHAPWLAASADDLTDAEERYDSIWQACVPDGWDASGFPSQASEAPGVSEHPSSPPEALVPDVIITKVGHDYQVCLNDEGMPRLRLSATSRRMVREGQGGEPEARQYLDDKLRAAVWLIRSLEQRRQMLLKVATSLVTYQRDCLDHGLAHLKPLPLTEVAEALGLHASTVSCVLTNKYLATAHGIIALTDFFHRGLKSAGGEPRSSLTVTETPQFSAAASLHQWVEQIHGMDFSRLAADPEGRAAYRDLQTALAHPQLRPAVLLALRAFAQAAQAGATTPPPADAVEPVPRLQERPNVEALSPIYDLDHLLKRAIERVVTRLDIERASIILLDEARDELYVAKVADENRVGHAQRLREVRFPATQGIAGWVLREGHSLIVPDVDHDPRVSRGIDVHAGTKTRSLLCVPLRAQERIIGVLQGINKRQGPFTAEDVRRLEAFANELARALEHARAIQARYNCDVQQLIADAEHLANRAVPFDTLVGESPAMQQVYRLVQRARHTTATVLLTGERGTGKDRLARILHDRGPRAQGPFIAVNCAAMAETLLEVDLFGYERDAFPGTTQRQPGRLELAAGGTLFLEEIDAMSPVLQAKLRQVLQDRQFERLGGTERITTDARIIAATHQDLERLMTEGRFRKDLFYRLNVYPIALPPLRERQEDLGPLTMFFLKSFSQKLRKEVLGISKEAMGLLERYAWPGNVRELENIIERAVILCQGPVVAAQDLPSLREQLRTPVLSGDAFRLPPGGIVLAEVEKAFIRQALEQSHQNKSHAAKLLRLSRTELRTRMRQYGLETD